MELSGLRSLVKLSTEVVLVNADLYASQLYFLPINIKNNLLYLMSKRGLLHDNNVGLLVHQGVTELDLTESDISDNGLIQLERCSKLSKLDLNSISGKRTNISSLGFLELFKSLKYLHIVYLRRCVLIDDRPITVLAKSNFLSELNLGGCPLITDRSVITLSHSSSLKCINLSRTKVTDKGLISLATGYCKNNLRELQVSNCQEVTDVGIKALSQNCKRLTILTFHGCPRVSVESSLNINANEKTSMKMLTWTIY